MFGQVEPVVCFEFGHVVEDALDVVAYFSQQLRADQVAVVQLRQDVILGFLRLRPEVNLRLLFVDERSAEHAD